MENEEKIGQIFFKNYGIFLPLLSLYLFIVFFLSKSSFHGDEWRYVYFAKNLLHGFYSPSGAENVKLWNGPGYPMVLVPFAAMKLPWITAKVANAFFLFSAVIFFYRTLCLYIKRDKAKYCAFFFGMYFPFMSNLHFLNTETFTVFLITVFSFFFCHQAIDKSIFNRYLITAAFSLAWLMLTKIIFGYIVLFIIVFSLIWCLLARTIPVKKCLLTCCLAMLMCFPYLFYTHSLTGKIFYWGNSGGLNLYWMSSPYPNEFGDCYQPKEVKKIKQLARNHGAFFDNIEGLNLIKKDDALKKQALINIMKHPAKYVVNIISNIGRMIIDYPYSYKPKPLKKILWIFWIFPNSLIFSALFFSLFPTWKVRKAIPVEIIILILFGFSAFCASSLVSACARHFYVLVPFWAIWLAFLFCRNSSLQE